MAKVKEILVGDVIQARRTSPEEPVEIAEGVVASTDADIITLGTRQYSEKDGWKFELVSRSQQALVLPNSISEIYARLFRDQREGVVFRLIGKKENWKTESGERVPVEEILSWEFAED